MDTINPFVRLANVSNAWVEIRNLEQASASHRPGVVLRGLIEGAKNGGHYHELMKSVRVGDVVIHIQELSRGHKYFVGASIVAREAVSQDGHYIVALRDKYWLPADVKILVSSFIKKNGNRIRKEVISLQPRNYPFMLRSDRKTQTKRIVLAQRYLTKLTANLANLILNELKGSIRLEETEEEYRADFETAVANALTLDREEVRRRASSMQDRPERILRYIYVFNRNPYVVAEVLRRAALNGCEEEFCTNRTPFRKPGGLPFLEVHHRIPLAQGGLDTIENAIALCPNCHRKAHYGDAPDKA